MQRQRGAISPNRRLASQTMRELTLACVRGIPNRHPAATSWPRGTGLDDVSRRQKALICSDFCRLADAKPTCVAAKTRNSLARTPTWADATGGGTALQTERELVGGSRTD